MTDMWMYWLIFYGVAWMALTHMRTLPMQNIVVQHKLPFGGVVLVFLTLVIGLRHEVGGDWDQYLIHLEYAFGQSILEEITHIRGEFAYRILAWFGSNVGGGIYLVNTVCAALFSWGLLVFCRIQPRPWLALLVAVPFLVTVVAMGYTRQGAAIGLVMRGLVALRHERTFRFILWVVVAALFHKSAAVMVPLAFFVRTKHRWSSLVVIVIATVVIFVLLLQEHLEFLSYGYIEQKYSSAGAGVRIAMNILPAAVFLLWRSRFVMTLEQIRFWTWMSWGAVGFVGLLWVFPSSTAVDRLALYWIPLQLVVWSHLPDVLGHQGRRNPGWVISVVAYSAIVQFTWLSFGVHANSWLPYQFYPWVWLVDLAGL